MRETKLYMLEEHTVLAHPTADFYRIHRQQALPDFSDWISAGDDMLLMNNTTEDLPIHMVSRIEYGQRKDEFFVIDPHLQEILEAPFIHRVASAELQADRAQVGLINLQQKIDEFNSLPWYKRIFKKV